MHKLQYTNCRYQSSKRQLSLQARIFPSILFYLQLIDIVYRASKEAQQGNYDDQKWVQSSFDVLRRLEEIGVKIDVEGIENIEHQDGPVVFIGNHMSMMETLLLPAIIQPVKATTFVVKESLLAYPVFKHVMRAREPVAVSRTNPRQDLKVVLNEGGERLKKGISVIVFPQTTRSHIFESEQMSSIGVKLAKKSAVPIIPLALKTDCWQNGKMIKDFGRLDNSRTAHFAFGKAIHVSGKGDDEHVAVNAFIEQKLQEWRS